VVSKYVEGIHLPEIQKAYPISKFVTVAKMAAICALFDLKACD